MNKNNKSIDVYKCKLVKEDELKYKQVVSDSDEVVNILRDLGLPEESDERIIMLCLNSKGVIIGLHEISHGDLNTCPVHPREVFKRALINNAYGIILAHNHPSGDLTPSHEDINMTERLIAGGRLLGINVLDHVIVAETGHESLQDYMEWR